MTEVSHKGTICAPSPGAGRLLIRQRVRHPAGPCRHARHAGMPGMQVLPQGLAQAS